MSFKKNTYYISAETVLGGWVVLYNSNKLIHIILLRDDNILHSIFYRVSLFSKRFHDISKRELFISY